MANLEGEFCWDDDHGCICGNQCEPPWKERKTMTDNRWRNHRGFTQDIKDKSGAWFVNGPDGEDHALGCMFVRRYCAFPCTCDATRKYGSGWETSWERWMEAMLWNTIPEGMTKPFPWPITGPDGEPWIPGIDFNGE